MFGGSRKNGSRHDSVSKIRCLEVVSGLKKEGFTSVTPFTTFGSHQFAWISKINLAVSFTCDCKNRNIIGVTPGTGEFHLVSLSTFFCPSGLRLLLPGISKRSITINALVLFGIQISNLMSIFIKCAMCRVFAQRVTYSLFLLSDDCFQAGFLVWSTLLQ